MLFLNFGMLELTHRVQTFRDFPIAVRYLVKSEATLESIPERQYVHFKHDNFSMVSKNWARATRDSIVLFYLDIKKTFLE